MLKQLFFIPMYNLFIASAALVGGSVGWAIILITLFIKIITTPFTLAALRSQKAIKEIEPKMKKIQSEVTNKEEQAKQIMELYKEHKVNPLAGCLPMIVQLVVLITLYQVIMSGLIIKPEYMYSFIPKLSHLNLSFYGIDLSKSSKVLAIVAGIVQFLQMHYSLAFREPEKTIEDLKSEPTEPTFSTAFGESMKTQMKYMAPILIAVTGFALPAAAAIYWIVSSLLTWMQEIITEYTK
jgi:YidC/Oxa1 family membrane protein insertase